MVKTRYAVEVARVSDSRNLGDSDDRQIDQTKLITPRVESQFDCKIEIVKTLRLLKSATVRLELQPLLQAAEFIKSWNKDNPNKRVEFLFVRSIDRHTRGGGVIYGQMKAIFSNIGVMVVDTYGVIGNQIINRLEYLDVKEYDWAYLDPTFTSELIMAEQAKNSVRDTLASAIGAEIKYVRKGYSIGPAHWGLFNKKIDTSDGKRVVEVKENSQMTDWILQMFEMAISGISDKDIADKLNKAGFLTPKQNIHSPEDHNEFIGQKGGIPLTDKQVRRILENPIYAGINKERWTSSDNTKKQRENYKALRLCYPGFPGLVPVEMWNKANKGRWIIVDEGEEVLVVKGDKYKPRKKREDITTDFPFRKVLCPHCRQPVHSSFNGGRNDKFPSYHCHSKERQKKYGKHYFRISRKDFHQTITEFVRDLRFKEDKLLYWKKYFIEEWNKTLLDAKNDSRTAQECVTLLETEEIMLRGKLKWASTPESFKVIEEELEKVTKKKAQALIDRQEMELKALKWEEAVNYCFYFFEHLEDLLLGSSNPIQNGKYFAVIFREMPTYEEIKLRTAKLEPCIEVISSTIGQENTDCELSVLIFEPFESILSLYDKLQQTGFTNQYAIMA